MLGSPDSRYIGRRDMIKRLNVQSRLSARYKEKEKLAQK
jgi:hypothetical protein